jgi:hypothetical protein
MDLIFDTTPTGEDVRISTEKVARFMEPDENKIPPIVQFEWGTYTFQGMMESYRETIDFFAANGVPLRASINLTLLSKTRYLNPAIRLNPQTRSKDYNPNPLPFPLERGKMRRAWAPRPEFPGWTSDRRFKRAGQYAIFAEGRLGSAVRCSWAHPLPLPQAEPEPRSGLGEEPELQSAEGLVQA